MKLKTVKLSDICESMHQGINTVADKIVYQNEGKPIIQSKNITSGVLDLSDVKMVTAEKYDFYKNKYNPKVGDILLCNIGTIGKSILIDKENDFLIAWNLFLIKLDKKKISPAYTKAYFDYLNKRNYYDKFLTGGTVKFINKKTMGEVPVILPPLSDQIRIAEILSQAEALIAQRKQSISLLDELLKSTFLEMFGDPNENEKKWKIQKLNTLTKVGTGGTPSRKRENEFYNGNIYWAKTTEVNGSYIYNTEEKITYLALEESNCKIFPINTILLAMYGQGKTRGNVGYLKIQAATNQACAAIPPSENINQVFLFELLKSSYNYLRGLARGGNQENLNLNIVGNINIILPPITLQTKFANIVEKVEVLKSQYQQSLVELQNMYGVLSQKAFKGELKGKVELEIINDKLAMVAESDVNYKKKK